jgi:hypothetical protein
VPLHLIIVSCLALLAMPWSSAGAESLQYRVAVDLGLARMTVTLCGSDGLLGRLTPVGDAAETALISATLAGAGPPRPIALGDGALVIPAGASGCRSYELDLARTTDHGDRPWYGLLYRGWGALLVSPHLFLWAPSAGLQGATLTFDLPPGPQVSATWPESDQGGGIYRLGGRPLEWDARVAIGRFDALDLAFPGGRLAVAVLMAGPPVEARLIRDRLTANALGLGQIAGDRIGGLSQGAYRS